MSSKGRGAPVADAEFYPTPAWCTRRILEALPVARIGSWLEPCVGNGAIADQIVFAGVLPERVSAGDIRAVSRPGSVRGGWFPGESFELWEHHYDAIITNPPFSLAPELIEHFLPRCDWLILLLRSAFRLAKWRDNMPDEYKLPQRPEFLASEKCTGRKDEARLDELGEPLPVIGCGWARKIQIAEARERSCPKCGGSVQRSTSDNSEYSWFVWTPERNRSAGLTRVLPDTPLSERKAT